MSTETHDISVSGIRVSIARKDIKNLHLGVYPPQGRVRVAAPLAVSDDAVRLAIVGKLGWIKRQRKKFEQQARQSEREMVSGETHHYLGRRFRLQVVDASGADRIVLRNRTTLELQARPESSPGDRERVLQRWYRERLRELLPPLLTKWQELLGVQVTHCGIKKMKTKWGSCNIEARRIWLNLELAKKSPQCLEYLVAHELTHLLERHHNDRFNALMDRYLPHWRGHRKELNAAPLAKDSWSY